MVRVVLCVVALGALVGCGVEGSPWTPHANANIGVGSGGVYTSGSVGVSNGPVSISIGGGCRWYGC